MRGILSLDDLDRRTNTVVSSIISSTVFVRSDLKPGEEDPNQCEDDGEDAKDHVGRRVFVV